MIRRIQIKNYKSLKNIEVNLGQLAVIFGPNAVGKSNLFDALNLLGRLVTKKNLKEAFDGHRGLPIEAVHYDTGTIRDLRIIAHLRAHQLRRLQRAFQRAADDYVHLNFESVQRPRHQDALLLALFDKRAPGVEKRILAAKSRIGVAHEVKVHRRSG